MKSRGSLLKVSRSCSAPLCWKIREKNKKKKDQMLQGNTSNVPIAHSHLPIKGRAEGNSKNNKDERQRRAEKGKGHVCDSEEGKVRLCSRSRTNHLLLN